MPSCSFVEHTEGANTYTLLIKILQMQNSPLPGRPKIAPVTTFSPEQIFFPFSLLLFIISCQVFSFCSQFQRARFGWKKTLAPFSSHCLVFIKDQPVFEPSDLCSCQKLIGLSKERKWITNSFSISKTCK